MMSDDRPSIRFKFSGPQLAQWQADISLIRSRLGNLPYKYLVLSAVHQWANRIRVGREIEETQE